MPSMDTTSEMAAALESAHTDSVGPGEIAGVQKETRRLFVSRILLMYVNHHTFVGGPVQWVLYCPLVT